MSFRKGLIFVQVIAVSALLFGLGGFSPHVEARVPRILRLGTKPGVYEGGLGPLIGIINIGTTFQLHNSLGFHFFGNSSGPALGGDLDIGVASGYFGLTIGPRFWWDIPIARMSIYVAPFLRMGYRLGIFNSIAFHALNILFGARFKVILNNVALLFFQPVAFSMNVGGGSGFITTFVMEYSLLFGAGVTF